MPSNRKGSVKKSSKRRRKSPIQRKRKKSKVLTKTRKRKAKKVATGYSRKKKTKTSTKQKEKLLTTTSSEKKKFNAVDSSNGKANALPIIEENKESRSMSTLIKQYSPQKINTLRKTNISKHREPNFGKKIKTASPISPDELESVGKVTKVKSSSSDELIESVKRVRTTPPSTQMKRMRPVEIGSNEISLQQPEAKKLKFVNKPKVQTYVQKSNCHTNVTLNDRIQVLKLVSRVQPSLQIPTIVALCEKTKFTIGRQNDANFRCDIVLDSVRQGTGAFQISRFHAVIRSKNNSYYIMDRGSTNGTFINGKRHLGVWTKLMDGDVICFGANHHKSEFVYLYDSMLKAHCPKDAFEYKKQLFPNSTPGRQGSLAASRDDSKILEQVKKKRELSILAEKLKEAEEKAEKERLEKEKLKELTDKLRLAEEKMAKEKLEFQKQREAEKELRLKQSLEEKAKLQKLAIENSQLKKQQSKAEEDKRIAELKAKELKEFRNQVEKEKIRKEEDDRKEIEKRNAELECQICTDWCIKAHNIVCGHTFCKKCLFDWIGSFANEKEKKPSCPTCREPIPKDYKPVPNLILDKLISEHFINEADEDTKEAWDERVEEHQQWARNLVKKKKTSHVRQPKLSRPQTGSSIQSFFRSHRNPFSSIHRTGLRESMEDSTSESDDLEVMDLNRQCKGWTGTRRCPITAKLGYDGATSNQRYWAQPLLQGGEYCRLHMP